MAPSTECSWLGLFSVWRGVPDPLDVPAPEKIAYPGSTWKVFVLKEALNKG